MADIAGLVGLGLACVADGDQKSPEVALGLETTVYDLTQRYTQIIRQAVEEDMRDLEKQALA